MQALLRAQFHGSSYKFIKNCQHCNTKLQCNCIASFPIVQLRNDAGDSRRFSSFNATAPSLTASVERHFLQKSLLNPALSLPLDRYYVRNFSLSYPQRDKDPLKPSSKVEATVQELKKKQESELTEAPPKAVVKKSLKQKIVDEIAHYYHGFRLLFIDIKISTVLVWRVLNGKSLTRREYRLLTRTVGDMFRLVPFSVFIIVPFMEFLLPVFIKFFPGMLPSTFQTATEKEDKMKQSLKVKLEMAKFLQETLDDMAVQHKDHSSDQAKQFMEWFNKVRTSGELVSTEEIMKYAKLFEDEITLDSLSRSQLIALCRVLEVQTLGTNNFLRFQLRMKLRSLAADDKMIQKEGVNSLTLAEVQQACRARGMRAYGLSEERLRAQLSQWLDLSLNEKVPPSLLLLSRAMMLPETIPTSDKLKATISALPETIVKSTTAAIGEKEGKIDNKVKLEVLKEEERKIKEERQERHEERKKLEKEKELLLDKAPVLSAAATPILEDSATKISVEKLEKVEDLAAKKKKRKEEEEDQPLAPEDLEIIETAIEKVSKNQKYIVQKGEIEELKEQMADYQEDVEELSKTVASLPKPEIKESKAAQRLFKSVNRMINKLDGVLENLAQKEKQLKKDLEGKALEEGGDESADKKKAELLKIDDIVSAIKQIKNVPDQSRIDQIVRVLRKMDDDCDGSVKLEDVLKVIEIIGKENVKLSDKQMDELMELMDKEEILEVEDKIEKALQKDKEVKLEQKKEAAAQQKTKEEEEELSKKSPAGGDNNKTGDKSSGNAGKPTENSPNLTAKSDRSDSSGTTKDDPTSPNKPKFHTKPPIIPPPPPPPPNSIDDSSSSSSSGGTKPKNSSKVL